MFSSEILHTGIKVCLHMFCLLESQSCPFQHSWRLIIFLTTIARLVPLAEQELLTFPEHPSSSVLKRGSGCSIFSFLCSILLTIRCLFFLVLLVVVFVSFYQLQLLIIPLVCSNFSDAKSFYKSEWSEIKSSFKINFESGVKTPKIKIKSKPDQIWFEQTRKLSMV